MSEMFWPVEREYGGWTGHGSGGGYRSGEYESHYGDGDGYGYVNGNGYGDGARFGWTHWSSACYGRGVPAVARPGRLR